MQEDEVDHILNENMLDDEPNLAEMSDYSGASPLQSFKIKSKRSSNNNSPRKSRSPSVKLGGTESNSPGKLSMQGTA